MPEAMPINDSITVTAQPGPSPETATAPAGAGLTPPSPALAPPTAPQAALPSGAPPVLPPKKTGVAGAEVAFGRAAKNILGALYAPRTKTVIGDDGKESVVRDPQTRGQIFRHILAGALLGGAAAEDAHTRNPFMGFGGGAAIGAGTGIREEQFQRDKQRAEAEQEFKRKEEAKSETSRLQTQEEERKLIQANVAQANAATLELNHRSQWSDYQMHDEISKRGFASLAPEVEAEGGYAKGPNGKIYNGVRETDMHQYFKDDPKAAGYHWEHTGVIPTKDGSGNFEYLLSATDPTKPIKVTAEAQAELSKRHYELIQPNWKDVVTVGRQIPAQEWIGIQTQSRNAELEWEKRQSAEDKHLEQLARTKEADAAMIRANGENARDRATAAKDRDVKKKETLIAEAHDAWAAETTKADGDPEAGFANLKPGQRLIIANEEETSIRDAVAELKALPKDLATGAYADPEGATELVKQISSMQRLRKIAYVGAEKDKSGAPPKKPVPTGDAYKDLSANIGYFTDAIKGVPAKERQAYLQTMLEKGVVTVEIANGVAARYGFQKFAQQSRPAGSQAVPAGVANYQGSI